MFKRHKIFSAVVFMVIILSVSSLTGYADAPYQGTERLAVNLWWELEPMVSLGGEYPIPRDKAVKNLLEEARKVFSAMIYGYSFVYTPSDKLRKVSEVFKLVPVAELKWGDRQMEVVSTEVKDKKLYAKIVYHLLEYQFLNRSAWSSSALASVSGRGEGNIFKGSGQRDVSFNNAVKNAVSNYLRARVFNKPREIRGEVILWDQPELTVGNGMYITAVRIKLKINKIEAYRIF